MIQEKQGVAITSDKTDFKVQSIVMDKKSHYIMIKGIIHQGDVKIQTE